MLFIQASWAKIAGGTSTDTSSFITPYWLKSQLISNIGFPIWWGLLYISYDFQLWWGSSTSSGAHFSLSWHLLHSGGEPFLYCCVAVLICPLWWGFGCWIHRPRPQQPSIWFVLESPHAFSYKWWLMIWTDVQQPSTIQMAAAQVWPGIANNNHDCVATTTRIVHPPFLTFSSLPHLNN